MEGMEEGAQEPPKGQNVSSVPSTLSAVRPGPVTSPLCLSILTKRGSPGPSCPPTSQGCCEDAGHSDVEVKMLLKPVRGPGGLLCHPQPVLLGPQLSKGQGSRRAFRPAAARCPGVSALLSLRFSVGTRDGRCPHDPGVHRTSRQERRKQPHTVRPGHLRPGPRRLPKPCCLQRPMDARPVSLRRAAGSGLPGGAMATRQTLEAKSRRESQAAGPCLIRLHCPAQWLGPWALVFCSHCMKGSQLGLLQEWIWGLRTHLLRPW